jgi:hypothetical protein
MGLPRTPPTPLTVYSPNTSSGTEHVKAADVTYLPDRLLSRF